jgi:hypothetical protein
MGKTLASNGTFYAHASGACVKQFRVRNAS